MKIIDLKARTVAIPLNAQLRHNTGVHPGYFLRTVIEIVTDEGLVGLGEVGGGDQRGALMKLKPRILGLDPFHLEVIKLNTIGTLIPCQMFGREMARQGRGAIVNFASMNSYRPLTKNLAYSLSKAGVVNLTQWLAAYLAPAGIRVNAVAPGFFANERSRKILLTGDGGLTARGQNVMAHTPMKRFGEAQDLLGAVCWLLDDERAGFVTGITVAVDGGFSASSGV